MVTPLKLKSQRADSKRKSVTVVAEVNPVAKVLVNTPVSYLEDIYDYQIPQRLSERVIVGSIVKIEFGKGITEGVVLERTSKSQSKLKQIQDVIGWPGMIGPEVLDHLKQVQNRFGGSLWNLINSFLPSIPKNNSSEIEKIESRTAESRKSDLPTHISRPQATDIQTNHGVRYSISQPPGFAVFATLLDLIEIRTRIGQVLVIASDFREFDYLAKLLESKFGKYLTKYDSRLGKIQRFQIFKRICQQMPKLILGVRSSAFLPLSKNASVIVLNDVDKSHFEQRSPGWNTRDVTLLRGSDISIFFYSATPSFEIQRLIEIGWIKQLEIANEVKFNFYVNDGFNTFIPTIRKSLSSGNVLVSVAAKGYANAFLCKKCRNIARCNCGGKLMIPSAGSSPSCYLCREIYTNWRCQICGEATPYVIAKGLDRTAEEIAKALPTANVIKLNVDSKEVIVSSKNNVIVSSRGCEPFINYSGLILLDGEQLYNQPTLRAEELLKHNWFDLISRVYNDGNIYISLPNQHPLTQQILQKKISNSVPLKERSASKLPPFYRTCVVSGPATEIAIFSANLKKSNQHQVSPPFVISKEISKLIIRVDLEKGAEFVELMRDVVKMQGVKGKALFEYRFDPYDL